MFKHFGYIGKKLQLISFYLLILLNAVPRCHPHADKIAH